MTKIDVIYEGNLHCRLTHGPSGKQIVTDAPKDNMGKGEAFSPTDLVAAALGSCMMTLMGIFGERHGIDLKGTGVEVIKEMVHDPVRKIGKLSVTFKMAAGIPPAQRQALERAALTCPVHQNLHPTIEIPVAFQYPD